MSEKEAAASGGQASGSGTLPSPYRPPDDAAVGDLVSSLNRRRLYREVTLALRSGLRDANADFSFLRTRGLRNLLKFLRSIAGSDESIRLFRHSQTIPELQGLGKRDTGDWLQTYKLTRKKNVMFTRNHNFLSVGLPYIVIPVLFQNTLRQPKDNPVVALNNIFGVEPMKITSPATDSEVALALRVLEGCCLLYSRSAALAYKFKAIKVLVDILSSRGMLEQGACLDALISLMLESSLNQMEFEECHGIEKIAELIKDEQVDENIRLKCGEFLLLLIGHLNGRENSPLANINEDIRQLLGEKCASLIWAASQFGSTLDAEQRMTALHIQARRVVESIELSN